MSAAPAAIEVRGVTVGYGDRVVQENLDFQVRKGEVLAILGGIRLRKELGAEGP
jgi:ABC-type transporter Mla maintaining outer membrane lipid asymmetry ATPase subunit MlaF